MDSTTLFTFLLQVPSEVRVVELLGSWDNFSKPYYLHKEPLKGDGNWAGCYCFENIVFDGDRLDWSKPRTGGFKQGGRYWYYYRLDDDEEFYDPSQPQSSDCPLLPGQKVNVLDVPVEVYQPPSRSRSASADLPTMGFPIMTLDPLDRYKKIHRQPPTKLARFYRSTEALTDLARDHATSTPSVESQRLCSLPSTCTDVSDDSITSSIGEESTVDLRDQLLSVINFDKALPPTPPLPRPAMEMKVLLTDASPLQVFGPSYEHDIVSRPSSRHGSTTSASKSTYKFHESFSRPPSSNSYRSYVTSDPGPEHQHRSTYQRFNFVEEELSEPSREVYGGQTTVQKQGLGIAIAESPKLANLQPSSLPTRLDTGGSLYHSTSRPTSSKHQSPSPSWQSFNDMDYTTTGVSAAYSSPQSDNPGFDISSPTFTAETVSSAGFNTPYRLCSQSPRRAPLDNGQHHDEHVQSLTDVSHRLSRLSTSERDEPSYAQSYTFKSHQQGYPHADVVSSEITLKRLPSPQPKTDSQQRQQQPQIFSVHSPLLPIIGLQSTTRPEPSLADSIFGELGYLSDAIH